MLKKKTKKINDYLRIISTPRVWNPGYFLIGIILFIIAIGIGIFSECKLAVEGWVEHWKENRNKVYDWHTGQWMSPKDYLFVLGEQIKDKYRCDILGDSLAYVKKSGLEFEVILSAFHYMEVEPNSTMEEALNFGLEEWIK